MATTMVVGSMCWKRESHQVRVPLWSRSLHSLPYCVLKADLPEPSLAYWHFATTACQAHAYCVAFL